jgi:hypothetical protein
MFTTAQTLILNILKMVLDLMQLVAVPFAG